MSRATAGTHQKALAINLDPTLYGAFAEIGAGQEVARWFFRVGGAAGTVARTMSAYDMAVSDQTYGRTGRYVSRERLGAMLEREFDLLVEVLAPRRPPETRFFVFADTVAERSYQGTNECHGWIGVRFQAAPRAAPSDVLLHVNLMDHSAVEQQAAVGILGVNLIHAALLRRESPAELLQSLHDSLSLERIELDVVHLAGPAFPGADGLRIGLELVRGGQANAVAFDAGGRLVAPTELLHRRPVVVERRLARGEEIDTRMLRAGLAALQCERAHFDLEPLALLEISLAGIGDTAEASAGDEPERHLRAALGTVPAALLTSLGENYRLSHYLRRYTREPVRFVVGASTLVPLLEEHYYEGLPGGLLEGIGKLLAENVRLYVYPMQVEALRAHLARYGVDPSRLELPADGTIGAEALPLQGPLRHLLRYLVETGWLVPLSAE